jgi:oligoribonuclease
MACGAPGVNSPVLLSAVRDELVWIDCEMTGLDLRSDRLIEIAVLVTDGDLNILGEGVDVVIHADDDALNEMIEVVTEMHTRSGLIDEVRASTIDVAQAEAMVLDYIRAHVPQAKTAPLAGNSVATDRGFIARDMPALDDFLHYRMVDVSSIKELCRRWYPRIYFGQPEKGLAHRALADIHESIRELRYYRRTAFIAPPGPSTSEIAAIAAQIDAATTGIEAATTGIGVSADAPSQQSPDGGGQGSSEAGMESDSAAGPASG